MAAHRNAKVEEMWDQNFGQGGWNLRFLRDFNDWEMDMIGYLLHVLRDYKPSMEEDSVWWEGGRNGKFRVKEAYRLVARPNDIVFPSRCIWVDSVPTKVAFYAWEATWGRVLTLDRLQKRGWQLPNCCFLCGCEEETVNHILIHCIVVRVLWDIVLGLSEKACNFNILFQDSDASIRKRALELIYVLVNDSNVKPLAKELIDYLEVSDPEFKGDLTAKICSIVEKFSPEKIWYIDQMLKVLSEAGNFVKDEVWHALIVVISNASDLHGYTVRSLYRAFQASVEQECLVRVAVWCIGEYGEMLVNNVGMLDIEEPITVSSPSIFYVAKVGCMDLLVCVTESDAVDVIEIAIKRHTSDLTTRAMALIALLKLSCRFPSCSERIRDIIVQCKGSLVLELQQRSIEFNSIIGKHQNIRSVLVERMPVLDEATYNGRRAGSMPATVSMSNDTPAPSSSGGDFLHDLLGVGLSVGSSSSGMTQVPKAGTDVLLDLLSIGTPPPAQSSLSTPDILSSSQDNKMPAPTLERLSSPSSISIQASSPAGAAPMMDLLDGFAPNLPLPEDNGPVYPSIVAFESSALRLTFNFSKTPANPQTTLVQASFTNLSPNIFTDFIFQAAVPKFLQLHLDSASGNTLPASGNGSITQNLRVTNTLHGKVPKMAFCILEVLLRHGIGYFIVTKSCHFQKPLVMRIRIAYKMNNKDVLEEGQINNFPRDL
ncbi:AP-1 complex subunit gamma-2 [Vitis vinifera]|uniref:AP-1 complex subunit gamma-2 n=1 Tax=Vitis vinifera TaxID=29760 RepID=A0A438EHK6_VITVI|nr:AP-1 complex subunit gamma-2 [Vitis vinifera]